MKPWRITCTHNKRKEFSFVKWAKDKKEAERIVKKSNVCGEPGFRILTIEEA